MKKFIVIFFIFIFSTNLFAGEMNLWNKVVSKIIALLAKGYVWIRKIFGWQPQVTAISNPYF